jgi:hypothetical protein
LRSRLSGAHGESERACRIACYVPQGPGDVGVPGEAQDAEGEVAQAGHVLLPKTAYLFDLIRLPGGAKGTRTPGLLHAMQLKRLPGLGFYGSYLDLPCPEVPASARQSAWDGCPLGCPHP